MPGTPLKAIDNIRCAVVAGSLDDSGNGASINVTDQTIFVRPQQTIIPASRRVSSREVTPHVKIVPSSAVTVLIPLPAGGYEQRCAVLSRVDGAATDSAGFLPDGGFLPESQPVGLTPVVPVQRAMTQDVIDLTVDEVRDAVTESQFRPTVVSTQMCAEPTTAATAVPKLLPRFGDFENSFAGEDIADHIKFRPVAISTQISPEGPAGIRLPKLCPRNGSFENSFADRTLMNGVPESGSGIRAETDTTTGAGTASATAESCIFAEDKDGIVLKPHDASTQEPSQHLASRSPSPELFDGEDAVTEKAEALEFKPPPNADPSSTAMNRDHPHHTAVAPNDYKIMSSKHGAQTTLAQRLANRKLKAEDSSTNDRGDRDEGSLKSEKVSVVMKSSVAQRANSSFTKVTETDCTQTRGSERLSTRSKMSLRDSKRLRRGVDFVDEINEVLAYCRCFKVQFVNFCLFPFYS